MQSLTNCVFFPGFVIQFVCRYSRNFKEYQSPLSALDIDLICVPILGGNIALPNCLPTKITISSYHFSRVTNRPTRVGLVKISCGTGSEQESNDLFDVKH